MRFYGQLICNMLTGFTNNLESKDLTLSELYFSYRLKFSSVRNKTKTLIAFLSHCIRFSKSCLQRQQLNFNEFRCFSDKFQNLKKQKSDCRGLYIVLFQLSTHMNSQTLMNERRYRQRNKTKLKTKAFIVVFSFRYRERVPSNI